MSSPLSVNTSRSCEFPPWSLQRRPGAREGGREEGREGEQRDEEQEVEDRSRRKELTTRKKGTWRFLLPSFLPFLPPCLRRRQEGGRRGGSNTAAVTCVDPPFPPTVVNVNDLGGEREGGRERGRTE
jgi:hypothetical protein